MLELCSFVNIKQLLNFKNGTGIDNNLRFDLAFVWVGFYDVDDNKGFWP